MRQEIAVAISRADGGISIKRLPFRAPEKEFDPETAKRMGFTLNGDHWEREVTDAVIQAEINRAPHKFNGSTWRRIEETDLPQRDIFRNAWADTGRIDVDMPKARGIWRERIRAERAPLLAALDTEFMRAIELKDEAEQARIAAEKQKLRDATADPRIDAAKTPEELKAIPLPGKTSAQTLSPRR